MSGDLFERGDSQALRASLSALDAAAEAVAQSRAVVEAALAGRADDISYINPFNDLVSLQQAAGLMRLNEKSVSRWLDRTPEAGVRIGGRVFVKKTFIMRPYRE